MELQKRLVLHESSEWLRYVLWGAAIGMIFLTASAIQSPVRDVVKIVASALGVLLLGFSGFVMRSRRIVVDPSTREVTVSSKGLGGTVVERFAFGEIRKILVVKTSEIAESLSGTDVARDRWTIALALEGRSVTLTKNLYLTRDQALSDARRIQHRLKVEISDDLAEGIAHLAQTGRKIEAIAAAKRALGMTTVRAKDYVEGLASRPDKS